MFKITGTGSYLPQNCVSNTKLSETVDTSDEWIKDRSGIEQRYFVTNELTSDLAVFAAQNALDNAGLQATDIDLIIVATTTPDLTFPSTAAIVQHKLQATNAAAFDVQAVCSGFIYGLSIAEGYFATGKVNNVLVIGAESMSKILDFNDRTTCVLFGDGAGAVVLSKKEENEDSGLIKTSVSTQGQYTDLLKTSGGPALNNTSGFVEMQGKEVFRHAVSNLKAVCLDLIKSSGLEKSDINLLIPHQANKRIIDSTAKALGLPEDKVIVTVNKHANTSAASIPLALDWANKNNKIKKGDTILLEAFGGGFTFGGALIKW